MRIVMDAYWWESGPQSLQGIVHGMVDEWSARYPEDELVLVTRTSGREAKPFPDNVEVVRTRVWPQAVAAMFVVPRVARRVGADATITHNFAPLWGPTRSVFVQDAIFATNPEWFTKAELAYFRWMLTSSRRAEVLFSSTATEAKRLRRHAKAKRVVPVGLGLDPRLIDAKPAPPVEGLESGQFVLAVGRLNIRKNLAMTLEGARLSGLLSPEFPLVIVGKRDGEWSDLPSWVDAELERGSVRLTGFVDVSALRWLLHNCELFVCLALDEGFGLPPVEASAVGARVLVSDRAVFRETLGSDATYVDPESPSDIGAAMRRLLDSAPISSRQSGQAAKRYTWESTVDAIRSELFGARGGAQ